MKKLFLLTLLILSNGLVYSQQMKVTGAVYDTSGTKPL